MTRDLISVVWFAALHCRKAAADLAITNVDEDTRLLAEPLARPSHETRAKKDNQ